jgi:hypothetical protein
MARLLSTVESLFDYLATRPKLRLIEADLRYNQPLAVRSETWQIKFQDMVVDCRDEIDAKSVARELLKKGILVTAQSTDRDGRVHSIKLSEIRLAE